MTNPFSTQDLINNHFFPLTKGGPGSGRHAEAGGAIKPFHGNPWTHQSVTYRNALKTALALDRYALGEQNRIDEDGPNAEIVFTDDKRLLGIDHQAIADQHKALSDFHRQRWNEIKATMPEAADAHRVAMNEHAASAKFHQRLADNGSTEETTRNYELWAGGTPDAFEKEAMAQGVEVSDLPIQKAEYLQKGGPGSGRYPAGSSQIAGKHMPDTRKHVYVAGRNGVFRSNLNSEWHKIQIGDTLAAIKAAFSKLRLRNAQTVELAAGSPDIDKVVCKVCAKKMSEPAEGESKPDSYVKVTWIPSKKDFARNADGSIASSHYSCGWNSTMGQIVDLGMRMRGSI
jgi:hypothetical protein